MSHGFILAAAITGSGLKGFILPLCAAVMMCGCAVRATGLSWSEDFNKKLGFAGSAIFSGIFVFIPETAVTLVTEIAKAVTA
ncbi:hypothetical protein ACE1OC_41255 [Streptomyces sp. DSM 116496]|uniref:hypothetical protein n=1 Tax=Streptomyces stoeckheimensis TaxID=3344656 RepID=UPI0038B31CEC